MGRKLKLLFKKIILHSIKQINNERTAVAIYHLLTGKKSIQTVQDAHMYNLNAFYGILQRLQISFYENIINQYEEANLLKGGNGDFVRLTNRGNEWLDKNKHIQIHNFNGIKYHQRDEQFMKRLLLFIQMLTNSKKNNYNYIPIVEERQYTLWARQVYHEIKDQLDENLLQLEKELLLIGEKLSDEEANIFIDRLTGYKIYGQSIYQLSDQYKYTPVDIQLILVKVIHRMMDIVTENPDRFYVLARMLPSKQKGGLVTNSAKRTFELLKLGHNIEQIAKIRKLRLGTIQDHIVEISLYDHSFPFDDFLSESTKKEIFQVMEELNTFKLKQIKDKVNDKITYFEIRLALSKYNQNKDEY